MEMLVVEVLLVWVVIVGVHSQPYKNQARPVTVGKAPAIHHRKRQQHLDTGVHFYTAGNKAKVRKQSVVDDHHTIIVTNTCILHYRQSNTF